MKFCSIYKSFILLFVIIFSINVATSQDFLNQDINNRKEININYKGKIINTLEGAVWIRLKPNTNKSKFQSKNNGFELIPLLPNNLSNSLQFKKSNILSANDEIGDKISRTYILLYNTDIPFKEFEKKIKQEYPEIEAIEPYYTYELLSPEQPNDQWYEDQFSLESIKAKEAFSKGLIGSSSTIIGISDAGTQVSHIDLKDNIAYNTAEIPRDGIDNDNNGYIDDYAGYNFAFKEDNSEKDYVNNPDVDHGTIVTSIASATTDNSIGIAGAGNQCKYFPIKVAVGSSVRYGYQSIIYAGVRGLSVVNCSWGKANKPFSQFEQDIINFAISRNVVVVAASGNRAGESSLNDVYYPANYSGVLGVGASNSYGNAISSTTTLSLQTSILAPGTNKSIDKYGYSISTNSTSYATPIISGFVALIRSKYPELNPIETIEFARLCVDDVRDNNLGYEFFLPGFVNFMKAINNPPSSIISLRPQKIDFFDNENNKINRLSERDKEYNIKINAHSYFADADNITFKLEYFGNSNGIELINKEVNISNIKGKSDFEINGFKFKVTGNQPDFSAFRVNIYKDNNYIDYFIFPVYFNDDITTFSNKTLTFSVSDYGRFGFSINDKTDYGKGFTINGEPSYLSRRAGITLTVGQDVFTAGTESYSGFYDFIPLKRLNGENSNISIINLSNSTDYYDIALSSKYSFVDDSLPIIRIELELQNNGKISIANPAYGIFFDWDLPNSSENLSSYFPQGIPEEADKIKSAAQIVSNFERNKNIATLAFTFDDWGVAQTAGFEFNSFDDNKYNLTSVFNSGTTLQTASMGDLLTASGMKFTKTMQKGDKNKFDIIIAFAENEKDLIDRLALGYRRTYVNDDSFNIDCEISPNPVNDIVFLKILNKEKYINYSRENILIYNIRGEIVQVAKYNNLQEINEINVSKLPQGKYLLLMRDSSLGWFIKK